MLGLQHGGASVSTVFGALRARYDESRKQARRRYYRLMWHANERRLELYCHLLSFMALLRSGLRTPRVLFFPNLPEPGYELWKICRVLGLRTSTAPGDGYALAVVWEDVTRLDPDRMAQIPAMNCPTLNRNCIDVSKSHVAEEFGKVFGYDLAVDPTTHQGVCVRKSETNGMHDGEIISCPIDEREPGYAYEKLINVAIDETSSAKIRVPVVGKQIPLIYKKKYWRHHRFVGGKSHKTEIKQVGDGFSKSEFDNIIEFCGRMGLDYGTLDVMRDRDDGRIYIVDCNKTPWGPMPSGLTFTERKRAVRLLAKAFREEFLPGSKTRVGAE